MIEVVGAQDILAGLNPWLERFSEESGKKIAVSGLDTTYTITVNGKARIVGRRNSTTPFAYALDTKLGVERLIREIVKNLLGIQWETRPWHIERRQSMLTNGLTNVRRERATAKQVMDNLSSYYLSGSIFANFTGPVSEFEEELFPEEAVEQVRGLLTELYALRAMER